MKKVFLYAAAGVLVTSCASDELVDTAGSNNYGNATDAPISFTTNQKNITRSYTDLNKADHYNFGVFAYKSSDMVNPIMPNYLVGYYDEEKGYQNSGTSTFGDQAGVADGLSYWMYEGMGSAEYVGTYAGGALTAAYTSNNQNQYLKFWDNSAAYTCFYAYAPYINGDGTATYVDGTAQDATGDDTYVLTIPNGTLKDGYDDPSLAEYMYASTKVLKADYGHDVALQFHRLNAKVNIKFWEDVPGYKVRILDLTKEFGVSAAASIKYSDIIPTDHDCDVDPEHAPHNYGYTPGKYYTKNGVKIKFNNKDDQISSTIKQFAGTTADNTTPLNFKSPTVAQIGENRYEAAPSPTTYYAIPKGSAEDVLKNDTKDMSQSQAVDPDLALTGFTFHVSYELTAEDTGEKIVVRDATVHVPFQYTNWEANTHYTYIFKITKNSNGSTEVPTKPIDPTDPEVPTTPALYPIVFDNCTVVDWVENESEWVITEGTGLSYHNITLTENDDDMYSFKSDVEHILTVKIADEDKHNNHEIDYSNVTVSGPDANVTYASKQITVPANAAAGVYTVTYTCPDADINGNHPQTWTQTFFVGNEYDVALHHYEIGCNWSDATQTVAKLNITTTKDGTPEEELGAAAKLSIDYPVNFTPAQMANVTVNGANVEVKHDATPGTYQLVYTIEQGDKSVVVAKKTFEVKDYSLKLDQTVVFNAGAAMTVSGNQASSDDFVYSADKSCSALGKVITVPTTTDDNTTVTVTYTVWNGTSDAAKTSYTATFVVKNTHSVAVDKTAIDRNDGTSSDGDYTKDVIVVTTLQNGVATTDNLASATASKLSVVTKDADGNDVATADGDFTIAQTDDDANTYNLKVKNNVASGDYYVKYVSTVGGADKAEYVHFVVTE